MGTKHMGEPAEVIIGRMEIAWREVMPSEIGSRLICKLEAKYSDLKVESPEMILKVHSQNFIAST